MEPLSARQPEQTEQPHLEVGSAHGAPSAPANDEAEKLASASLVSDTEGNGTQAEAPEENSIFGRLPAEITSTSLKATRAVMREFSADTLALISSVFGGYESDPNFIRALVAAAQAEGMTLEQYIAKKKSSPDGRNEIAEKFKKSSILFGAEGATDGFAAAGLQNGHVVYQDKEGTQYIETGNGVRVNLRPGQGKAPPEAFTARHANNLMRAYIASRFKSESETGPDNAQELGFVISTTGFGMPARMREINDMMILAAIKQSHSVGIIPNIMKKSRFGRTSKVDLIDITKLHPNALAQMGFNSQEGAALIEWYNNRKSAPAAAAVIEGEPTAAPKAAKATATDILAGAPASTTAASTTAAPIAEAKQPEAPVAAKKMPAPPSASQPKL